MTSEWLIIGGGIHGTHLSLHLNQRGGVPRDRIRVLDPHAEPLAVWHQVTRAVGMDYLRSPIVHNLHWDQGSLGLFARIHQSKPYTRFIAPFGRPSLELFNAHAAHLIAKFRLDEMRVQARALSLARHGSGWRVETEGGALDADHVVLAIGLSDQPYWPDWVSALKNHPAVHHIFAPEFDREVLPDWSHAVVVGGGITAAQAALALAERLPGTVTLVRRHDERVHDFDADVGWMNAINLRAFAQVGDYSERRRIISEARHRGSMPSDVAASLYAAVQAGALNVVAAGVEAISADQIGACLSLSDGQTLYADAVVLATGYEQTRPGGALIDNLIFEYELPVASCGYPIVSQMLEWTTNLHVSGPLAELEIGPASRNIIGARMAGQRLASVV